MGCKCWYCGGEIIWQSDFNYDEVYDEGEGTVTYLVCSNCGADIEYSLRYEEGKDDEQEENITG